MTMFISLRLLALPPDRAGEREALVAALGEAAERLRGVKSCWVAPVSPVAVINSGDVVWRMTFATEREALAAPLDPEWRQAITPLLDGVQITNLGYRIANREVGRTGPGIWRALVFRIFPHADPALVTKLGKQTLLLPKYIKAIRSWALSPVAYCEGTKTFDFVWEQEFDSLDGLTGPYMQEPVHWGLVDAFFDADCPEYIVDPHLIQVVGSIDRTIMA